MTNDFQFPTPRTTGPNVAGPIPYIEAIVAGLGQVSVAVPIVFATVKLIRDLWKKARPGDPAITDAQLIDLMEAKFQQIGAVADEELARLREENPDEP